MSRCVGPRGIWRRFLCAVFVAADLQPPDHCINEQTKQVDSNGLYHRLLHDHRLGLSQLAAHITPPSHRQAFNAGDRCPSGCPTWNSCPITCSPRLLVGNQTVPHPPTPRLPARLAPTRPSTPFSVDHSILPQLLAVPFPFQSFSSLLPPSLTIHTALPFPLVVVVAPPSSCQSE